MNGDVGMHHAKKLWKQGSLSNTIKYTSTIMRNALPELCREELHMIVLVYLIVLLRELLVSSVFLQENREEKQNHYSSLYNY